MREHHLPGFRLRRRVRTTVPEPANAKVPELLDRDFTAPAPNLEHVGDITYHPLACGRDLYLATVIDCYSRRRVGSAVADHMRTDLVATALLDTAATRGDLAGAVFHADHGAQETSRTYAEPCARLGVLSRWARSVAAPATPWPSRSTPPSSATKDDPGACHEPCRRVAADVATVQPPEGTPTRPCRPLTRGFSCSPVWT